VRKCRDGDGDPLGGVDFLGFVAYLKSIAGRLRQ